MCVRLQAVAATGVVERRPAIRTDRRDRRRWLLGLVAFALLRSLVLGAVTPPYQVSDEPWHLDDARVIHTLVVINAAAFQPATWFPRSATASPVVPKEGSWRSARTTRSRAR